MGLMVKAPQGLVSVQLAWAADGKVCWPAAMV